ncbi:Eco57I restriction-modification methylase domain-containing protein [Nocardiopsis lambiniae]|uniref:site-specific DNA-methyltransferase (adenine-specific) n=1 Tax=Nocardiopsis lambiniae TaxID=3075539 RepID=A0ABU2M953_9ACTN|nr:DNA methyltransferase [Nocardiopsis sp. DSM 44743]MDT0329194.1 DNA methyltransferase [Nocardiopsis sp. DSM 44743]
MSAIARNRVFESAQTVGGLLPADMLVRISEGKDVEGAKPADYGVRVGSVSDEAERRWEYLKGVWRELRKKLPVEGTGEGPAIDSVNAARPQWVEPLFNELGFGWLNAGPGEGIASDDGAKRFKITHLWQHVPIHVVAWHADLDKRPGGAGTVPPQSYVQEMLNSSSAHLWAVVTNGRQLRLLRDSSALATAAYVEFDLEAIFDGELFNEFVLLFRLLHASRFAVEAEQPPATCWLEKWRGDAIKSGARALEQLSENVREAISALGTGFLKANPDLRKDLDVKAFHGALLRLVYRMLFLFVAEDRDALHPPGTDGQARERYAKYFSSARLRRHARRRRGTSHGDLYQALTLVLDALGGNDKHPHGRPEIGVPALGGLFTATEADAPLHGFKLNNEALLGAVRHLAQVRDTASRRWLAVNYRNLDAEELGSIYESLLELVPKYNVSDLTFELRVIGGNDRKTTGSYYTPSSLIETLLDSALDPVIDDAVKRAEQNATAAGKSDVSHTVVEELLSLTVCDPACGSGHFLVAAARRIAKRVAAVREGNPEPTVGAVRHALHEVVARCIYGVDLNPMAVELAKVSLWLEALDPGKPLNFLDAHVKHGNALIGATPALMRQGIPDAAFIATEGDDKKHAKALEKINAKEREGQESLFDIEPEAVKVSNSSFASRLRQISAAPAESLEDVRRQEKAFEEFQSSDEYTHALHLADAWCSAFMAVKDPKQPRPVTEAVFQALQEPEGHGATEDTNQEIIRLRKQYDFFHWYLEFPDVFSVLENDKGINPDTGWSGGFDCVLGNPPWDSVELKEQEFFAQRDPEIAEVSRASERKKMIAALKDDPDKHELYREYAEAKRKVYAESHFLRRSGRVPLTGKGNLNVYAVFAETDRILLGECGRCGVIVPTGIATDARTQYFFKDLVQKGSIAALYDFENRSGLFPAVDSRMKFCILSLAGRDLRESEASFAFFLHDPAELDDADKAFTMTPQEITLLNPNTGTCPIFRSRRDAEITLGIYRRVPVLVKEGDPNGNPWGVSFMAMFHMSHDSHLFRTYEHLEKSGWILEGNIFVKGEKRMLPLYEAKMIHHYDHRWATYAQGGDTRDLTLEEKKDSNAVVMPRYWVSEGATDTGEKDKYSKPVMETGVQTKLDAAGWGRGWLLGWRDICRSTDLRTSIISFVPKSAVGDKYLLMFPDCEAGIVPALVGMQASFAFDFSSRQKLGGTSMKFFTWKQLPFLSPGDVASNSDFISRRVLELTFTSKDMISLARDLDDQGNPFLWEEGRRFVMRVELDALFFHLYGIDRDDVEYIMETFPIVKKKDVAKYGTYRTKERILEIYDRMAEAGVSQDTPLVDGENFISELTPPPGHGPRHAPVS